MLFNPLDREYLKREVTLSWCGQTVVRHIDGERMVKVFCMGTVKDANDMEGFYLNRPESYRCR